MTAVAGPGNERSTHHLVLTRAAAGLDPEVKVGLILCDPGGNANPIAGFSRDPTPGMALHTSTGPQQYSDIEWPWVSVVQEEWMGGRGWKWFHKDESRYADGSRVDATRSGQVFLGGMDHHVGVGTHVKNWPHWGSGGSGVTYDWATLQIDTGAVACSFVPAANVTITRVYFLLRKAMTPIGAIGYTEVHAAICANTGGAPGAVVGSAGQVTVGDANFEYTAEFGISISATLTGGTTYWLKIWTVSSFTAQDNLQWLVQGGLSGTGTMKTASSGVWGATDTTRMPFFLLSSESADHNRVKFEYKGALFEALNSRAGGAPQLFVIGDSGEANGGAATTLTAAAAGHLATWADGEAVGCVIELLSGTGAAQEKNYRLITANTTAAGVTTFTVSPAWDVAPAAGTVFAIKASGKHTEITGHGLTGPVTDVLPLNGYIYFAQGDGIAIRRMELYDVAGTWTARYAAETNNGTFLASNADLQGPAFWYANVNPAQIVRATPATTWAGMTFGTAIPVGDSWERITGLETYDEYGSLIVFKEAGPWRVYDNRPYLLDLREMKRTRDIRNGRAHAVYGFYLWYSWHDGVERYYRGQLDDRGPDNDEGLPANRSGSIRFLEEWAGKLLAVVRVEKTLGWEFDSVLVYNGSGWHELYQAPMAEEITGLYVQAIPGNNVDRVWVGLKRGEVWLPIGKDGFNHPKVAYNFYPFSPAGYLTLSQMATGMIEIEKLFYRIKLVLGENYAAYGGSYAVDYRYEDGATAWTPLSGSSPFDIGPVVGKWIQFRVRLLLTSNYGSVKLTATVLELLGRLPHNFQTGVRFRVEDKGWTLQTDEPDEYRTAMGKLNALEGLANSARPVTLTSVLAALDGKTAMVNPASMRLVGEMTAEGREVYIFEMGLTEIG